MLKRLFLIWVAGISLSVGEDMKVGNFTFRPGEAWVKAEAGPMVKGALSYGKKDGLTVKFYHFGVGQGGGVEANVRRWRGQFEGEAKAETQEKKFGDQVVTMVTISGTYLDGPPFGGAKVAKPGSVMLGAILPHPSGDVFLKMTGAKDEMEKVTADFEALVASAFEEK